MVAKIPSIDTNVILALLLSERETERAAVLKRLARHEQAAIADLAITETVYVLEKSIGTSRDMVARMLHSLLANQYLHFNRALFERVIPYYLEHPAVSFNDCCLAVYAKLNGTTPLLTFDRKLARQIPHVELVTEK
ncbi:type II toxin-antitoxin system VapC family toxin [Candidatus Saccharibacteria bacterium]|nr:MAG: type II toxin-antitoxin system VapC family toxin [Candidatus Saccharibacteria bacterium]